MRALTIAATGMSAQQMRVEVISNNLANMSTTAYNARRAEFADLHYQQVKLPGTLSAADGSELPTGIQLGLGVRPAAVSLELAQGGLQETGGDLDLAIEGRGYLQVTLPSGEAGFTRDGALKRSAEGVIVTSDGYAVSPEIVIPEDTERLSVNTEGQVFAYFRGQADPEELGQFDLVSFANPKGLEALGGNLFAVTAASGEALIGTAGQDGLGGFRQGYLEASSVDAVREITELIEAQRGYELNSKVMSASDQMMAATVQVR